MRSESAPLRGGLATVGVVILALLASGCGYDSLALAFRPTAGSVARYRAITTTRTFTDLPGSAPDVEQQIIIDIAHEVLSATRDGTLLGITATFVRVTQNGLNVEAPEEVRSRFQVDRSGHAINLATNTVNASDTARQGLPEITAPFPPGRVRLGQQWGFSPPVGRGGFGGSARLIRLDRVNGVNVAEIEANLATSIEDTEIRGRDGPVTIGGPLTLHVRGTYEVDTGMLIESQQELAGDFRLRFALEGSTSPPVAGTQRLTVSTETRRA